MEPEQRLIPLAAAADWDSALEGLPHCFAHRHAYNAAMAQAADLETFLYYAESREFRLACPLMVRHFEGYADIVSPYGFAGFAFKGNPEGFAQVFHAFMASNEYVAGYIVQQLQQDAQSLTNPNETASGKQAVLLDITVPEEQALQRMGTDHRSRLRQWWKESPLVTTDKQKLAAPFLSLYPEAMQRLGAKQNYFFSDPALQKLIQQDNCLLIGIEAQGKIEAVSLFLHDDNYAEYYLNACILEGRRHARGLVWEAMRALRSKGVSTLNLGCGIQEGDALESFKRRFGGKMQRFQLIKQIYRPETYAALCAQVGTDPFDRGGFFPAYRNPSLNPPTPAR